jgi:multiple sugar transport system permease protein
VGRRQAPHRLYYMALPKARRGTLAARERRLAFAMLAPALLIVFLVVLFPVLANFWISLKEVRLGDLRPPAPLLRERVLTAPEQPGDVLAIRYQTRNSSPRGRISNVTLHATLPAGLEPVELDERCQVAGRRLRCDLGDWEGGRRENLELSFRAGPEYFRAEVDEDKPTSATLRGRAVGVLTSPDFTLRNFRFVLSGSEFWPAFWVTIVYTVGGSVFSILLGLFAAQLLNVRFPGQGFLRGLFLFPYVAPVIAVAFTWAFFLDPFSGSLNLLGVEFGLFDRPIAFLSQRNIEFSLFGLSFDFPLALSTVIAFEAWRYFPFAFLFILARFQAMPRDMYEAAEVDGASPLQQFRWITLPQLVGVLSTLFLLRFIWTFNKFDDIFLLTGGAAGTETLTIQVYDNAFARADIGAGAATAVLLFFILAIFMLLYFRFVPEEA